MQLCQKMNLITCFCQEIGLKLRSPCFKVELNVKSVSLFIFIRCSLFVWLIDVQPFTKAKKNRLMTSVSFRVQSVNKKDIWKLQSESTQLKEQCIVYENHMKIKVSVSWCRNKLTHGRVQLVCIYTLEKIEALNFVLGHFALLNKLNYFLPSCPVYTFKWSNSSKLEYVCLSYCYQFCCSVVCFLYFLKR